MSKITACDTLHAIIDADIADAELLSTIIDSLNSSTLNKVLHSVINSISEEDAVDVLEDYNDGYWMEAIEDGSVEDKLGISESLVRRNKLESRIRRLERAIRH